MICIPVVATTHEAALKMMERGYDEADIIEIRLDAIPKPDLKRLLGGARGKILVTHRSQAEGGASRGTDEERVALLKEAVKLGADYVDIEGAMDKALICELKQTIAAFHGATKLIVSWHDFSGTPPLGMLRKKFRSLMACGADIVKIVTFARKMEDNFRLLSLIPFAKRRGQEVIAFCMGDLGRSSRVLALLMGSYLTFAALEEGAESAPGQMTVVQMRQALALLKNE